MQSPVIKTCSVSFTNYSNDISWVCDIIMATTTTTSSSTLPTASIPATTTANSNINKNFKVVSQLYPLREEKSGLIREVGGIATWSLSSAKSGFGVEQLRDNCMETYWQSDGPQPHLVNITFTRKITIKFVCIYVDYQLDESYTPYKISIRAGNFYNDLQEIEQIEMDKPAGWVVIKLKDANDAQVRAFHIQIAVLGNHQSGRDTHLRQVKIYSVSQNALTEFHTPSGFFLK